MCPMLGMRGAMFPISRYSSGKPSWNCRLLIELYPIVHLSHVVTGSRYLVERERAPKLIIENADNVSNTEEFPNINNITSADIG